MVLKYCASVPARGKPDKEAEVGFSSSKEKQITDESKFFLSCLVLIFSKTLSLQQQKHSQSIYGSDMLIS